MEQVFQALIDRSRVLLDLKTVRTILGGRHRPKYRSRKKRAAEWEVAAQRSPHFFEGQNATGGWRLAATSLV